MTFIPCVAERRGRIPLRLKPESPCDSSNGERAAHNAATCPPLRSSAPRARDTSRARIVGSIKTARGNWLRFALTTPTRKLAITPASNTRYGCTRRLDRVFQAFFRRIKVGQEPGFPRFRGRNRFRTLTFTHGDGATFTETRTIPLRHPFAATVKIQGVGAVPLVYHRRLGEREGGQIAAHVKIGTVEIIHTGDQWVAVFSCTLTIPTPTQKDAYPILPATGIDVGLDYYASLADGEQVPNPRFLRKSMGEVKRLQRKLDRARKDRAAEKRAAKKRETAVVTARAAGAPIPPTPPVEVWVSKRGKKRPKRTAERRARVLSRAVARRHAKIGNQRAFFQWRLARSLIFRFGLIAVEVLTRRNMARRPKKTVGEVKTKEAGQPVYAANGVAAKSGLNKSIYDAAWGMFVQRLSSKAEEAGCLIVGVRAAGTSQRCPRCVRKTPKALKNGGIPVHAGVHSRATWPPLRLFALAGWRAWRRQPPRSPRIYPGEQSHG